MIVATAPVNDCKQSVIESNTYACWLKDLNIYWLFVNVCVTTDPLCARSGMVKQMEEDKCRFGAAAWASAAPRLEKLRFLLAKETLQHMRTKEMCLNRKKDGIRERVRVKQ